MNETSKLDPDHRLWVPIQRSGAGRMAVWAMLKLAELAPTSLASAPPIRLAFLTMCGLADIESWTSDGYQYTTAADLVMWTGMTEGEAEAALLILDRAGLAERQPDGEDGTRRYRPAREACEWINGEYH